MLETSWTADSVHAMTNYTTTTTTTDAAERPIAAGYYVPGHYERDDVRGEEFHAARYHLVDAEPMTRIDSGTAAYCGRPTTTPDDYLYDLRDASGGVLDAICPSCLAIARGEVAPPPPPAEPAACLLVDAGPLRPGPAVNVDDVDAVAAGRAAVAADVAGRPHLWHLVTVSAILAYWHHRHAAYWSDLRHVSRTMTAAARSRGWEHIYRDHMGPLSDRLPGIVRVDADRRTSFVAASGPAVPSRLVTAAPVPPPATVADIRPDVTVADIVAAVAVLERQHREVLDVIADTLVDAADEHDWCTDYERAIGDIVDGLSTYSRHAGQFRGRERERDYVVRGTVDVVITVPWSTVVTASDDDSAADSALDYVDLEDAVSDALYSIRREFSWHVDTDSAEIDEVEADS